MKKKISVVMIIVLFLLNIGFIFARGPIVASQKGWTLDHASLCATGGNSCYDD